MNYKQSIDFLFNKLPYYQRIGAMAYKADLGNTLKLDHNSGNPHKKYKTIHIAGTNGKGSVAHMLASVLQTAGYKTGLYTSPHLKDFRERIRINGKKISKRYVVQFVETRKKIISEISPSFFEITADMAFNYFADRQVDFAVIETGLGGRLDSTNIITPVIAVITNIGLDHTYLLGNTLPDIAGEKAGIIKEKVPVVIGETQEETKNIFIETAKSKNSPIYFADQVYSIGKKKKNKTGFTYTILENKKSIYQKLKIDLAGNYQDKNVITAISVIEYLKNLGIAVKDRTIYKGFKKVVKNTGLKGRFHILQKKPLIVCDTGHNFEGIHYVIDQLNSLKCNNLHIILGFVKDKEIDKILGILPKTAVYYFTQANIPRALHYLELKQKAEQQGLHGEAYNKVKKAYKAAKKAAKKKDVIYVGGSTFVVAEVL